MDHLDQLPDPALDHGEREKTSAIQDGRIAGELQSVLAQLPDSLIHEIWSEQTLPALLEVGLLLQLGEVEIDRGHRQGRELDLKYTPALVPVQISGTELGEVHRER